MPAEWTPHDRCWIGWPCRASLWGDGLLAARLAYAEVARVISQFEPVAMLAPPAELGAARAACGKGVMIVEAAMDDSWLRDTGPSFLIDGKGGLAGADWVFNGWGGKFQPFDRDAALAPLVLTLASARRFGAALCAEGGAIAVDGEGTLISTAQCLLNPNRNPALSRTQVEGQLKDHLGATSILWLDEGLVDDDTDGHVDNIAAFVRPGLVVAAAAAPGDANHAVLSENARRLKATPDAQGRPIEVVPLPLPDRVDRDGRGRRLPYSYVNFYLANGAVVVPVFDDPRDAEALSILRDLFPGRQIMALPGRPIARGGGGIHCITQQQPKP